MVERLLMIAIYTLSSLIVALLIWVILRELFNRLKKSESEFRSQAAGSLLKKWLSDDLIERKKTLQKLKEVGSPFFLEPLFFGIFNLWIAITQSFYPNASGGGIFCRRNVHKKADGFDETIKLSEDMDYAKRCNKLGKFGILRTIKAYISVRRFEKEGRFKIGFKLLLSAVYRVFFGEIRSDIFKYDLRYRK